jgi:hypothetical protein
LSRPDQGLAISRAMERVMRTCNAMIVNLTPFRGPSADVGSAYEMGFMRALGRPIFAYSNDDRPFLDRVAAFRGGALRVRPTGEYGFWCKLGVGHNRPPSGAVLRGRKHRIPDSGRTSIFEAQLAEVELSLADPAQQLNAGNRGRRGPEPLESEHRTDA